MKDKKRILLITDMNFPYGGASANFLRLFSTGLTENSVGVVVVLQRGHQYGNAVIKYRHDSINSVKYQYSGFVNRPVNLLLKLFDDFLGIVVPPFKILYYRIFKHVDYVVMYSSSAHFSVFNVLSCKLLNIPIFNFVVEWPDNHNNLANNVLNKIDKLKFFLQVKWLNTKYDGLIVLSHFLKNIYINHNVNPSAILIQPNLVDFSAFEIYNNNLSNNIIRIGYCGTPTQKDGISDLLKAFKIVEEKYKQAELLIIGDSPGNKSLLPGLLSQAESLGIEKQVVFTGLVDFKVIPAWLKACNIVVLSRPNGVFAEAGFPTKLGEYMACKIPVVVTKVGDIPLYLSDGVNAMLAEPDNPQSVADKISFLIDNPEQAKVIAEQGYYWAKEKLEYKKATKRIFDFIETM